jgi:PD-(D/E)XK nuclease superfamily
MTIDEARERLAHPKQVDRRGRKVVTYSQMDTFCNCRQKAEWRYIENLVPVKVATVLNIGHVNHEGLETWYDTNDREAVLDMIDRSYPERFSSDTKVKKSWHLSRAMLSAYIDRYSPEEFIMLATEVVVNGEIRNPQTGACSRRFVFSGKVDGVAAVENRDNYTAPTRFYLVEHKNISQLDSAFIDRLWQDFQTTLYAYYIEECFGIPISGVIYNALIKAKLEQRQGETEEAFIVRREEAISSSKTGKTSVKRRMPETDEEFQSRLAIKYREPNMFHREFLFIDSGQTSQVRHQLWLMTQAWLQAVRQDSFYQNTSYCYHWGRSCAYYPLCQNNGDPFIVENYFERREPHEELNMNESNDTINSKGDET